MHLCNVIQTATCWLLLSERSNVNQWKTVAARGSVYGFTMKATTIFWLFMSCLIHLSLTEEDNDVLDDNGELVPASSLNEERTKKGLKMISTKIISMKCYNCYTLLKRISIYN